MRVDSEIKLGFRDVLIRPKRSTLRSRSQVSLERTYTFRNSAKSWTGVPIIAANMDTIATFKMAHALTKHKMITALHKHITLDEWQLETQNVHDDFFQNVAISTGMSDKDCDKIDQILKKIPAITTICIDVANGYTEHFVDFVKRVRDKYPDKIIFAGNVVTGEMVEELIISGADVIKVGIGPGSVCTTRIKTGVGYPQLSAIIECADAAHGLSGHVISDGGCCSAGDIAKAFAAGADFVMLGGMLSGHDEGGGKIIEHEGKKLVEFYGMSSDIAMERHSGGIASYRASEGKYVRVAYKGPVNSSVVDILGGVRSACTYVGASRLKELSKRTTFVRVQEQENQIFS